MIVIKFRVALGFVLFLFVSFNAAIDIQNLVPGGVMLTLQNLKCVTLVWRWDSWQKPDEP